MDETNKISFNDSVDSTRGKLTVMAYTRTFRLKGYTFFRVFQRVGISQFEVHGVAGKSVI